MSSFKGENSLSSGNQKVVRRILLDESQAPKVAEAVAQLRSKSCKLDASKLVNKILSIFWERHLAANLERIEQEFFDKKSFIQGALAGSTSDQVDEILEQYLRKKQKSPKRRKQANRSQQMKLDESESS